MINNLLQRIKSDKVTSKFVFALLIMQPVLDIISFFVVESSLNIITTLLRMLIFAVVTLYAFFISDNKKYYFVMAGVLIVFFIFHVIACISEGYASLYEDIEMYIRTIQMPVYVLAFVTFFRKTENLKEQIGKAFWINYLIISFSIILSFLVGMPEYTYDTGRGIKGWFYTGNAQSCIISVMAPLALCYAYRKKKNWLLIGTLLLEFGNLYFFGTRVAYYSVFIVGIAFIVFLAWNKEKRWSAYLFTAIAMFICVLGYKVSPCYMQQYAANASYSEWGTEIDEILADSEEDLESGPDKPKYDMEYYKEIYSLYCDKLVERFGLEKVVEKYDYSVDVSDIISNRELKVNYGRLVMDEKNTLTRLFGFEYMDYIYDGEVYDPENDFPAIYFSCGYVGLAMYIGFILYFVIVAMKSVIADRWKISLEKGMLGTALVLMVVTAQVSGNVLRRPNVSIYLSIMLAYLFVISVSNKKEKNICKETQ